MPNSNVTPNSSQNESAKDSGPEDDQYIEHRVPVINSDGVQDTKVHRVKLSEWKAYEKEHKL